MKVEIENFSTRCSDLKSVDAASRNLQWRQVILPDLPSISSLDGCALKGRVQKAEGYSWFVLKTQQLMFWSPSIKNMTRKTVLESEFHGEPIPGIYFGSRASHNSI